MIAAQIRIPILKTLFTLSILTAIFAAGLLLWWDALDGTIFNRAMEDLRTLSSDDLEKHQVRDPWGNPYLQVEAHSGERAATYIFSQGPDGYSHTLGHDPDDITRWKSRFEWLQNLHPMHWVGSVLLVSGGVSLVSGVLISVQCRAGKSRTK